MVGCLISLSQDEFLVMVGCGVWDTGRNWTALKLRWVLCCLCSNGDTWSSGPLSSPYCIRSFPYFLAPRPQGYFLFTTSCEC